MVAGIVGNVVLVRWLLDSGANPDLTDNASKTAFDLILQKACHDKRFTQTKLAELFQALAPDSINVQANGRLIKIDQRHAEFLLLSVCLYFDKPFSAGELASILEHFPETVCPDYRMRRQYLSALLSKNELSGQSPYNRYLFQRIRMGKYMLNPGLCLKRGDRWEALTPKSQEQSASLPNLKIVRQWCRQIQLQTFLLPEEALQPWPPALKTQAHPRYHSSAKRR